MGLIWRLERMDGFTKDSAVKMVLFVLEYAVRFLPVPGRVENWILIVDLDNVGVSYANSTNRDIGKNCAVLLEQVYCGRNYQTKILSLPWVIKAVVNGFIPEDKKEKVQFLGAAEAAENLMTLFEPHQLEKRYGGTAPDLRPEETYPFRFFPNCTGKASATGDKSLHKYTNREFHEGFLWDESTVTAATKWQSEVLGQALTTAAVKSLQELGIDGAKPCTDVQSWLERVNPEEARRRA